MTAAGLLLGGQLVQVAGVAVIPPASHGGPRWAALSSGDCRPRPAGMWIRQLIPHTTGGRWPQPIIVGAGPGGEAPRIADIWNTDPVHSAAQIVVDSAGTVACLCDLVTTMAYHAEGSNPWSVGIEMYQLPNGAVYQATIDATARLCIVLCELLGIPAQMPRGPYSGAPLARMERMDGAARRQLGGPDLAGIFGHNHNTRERGRGDPGDAIWTALAALGVEALDFAAGEDIRVGRARQRWLAAHGAAIEVDGLVGPASITAARQLGYARWRDVPGAAAA